MNTCHPLYDRGAGIIRYDNNNNNSLRCKYATNFWKSFNFIQKISLPPQI